MKGDAIRIGLEEIRRNEQAKKQEAITALEALETENARLRTMLAFCHAGNSLYSDDGELQDNRAQPFIDFKRDPVDVIVRKMAQRLKEEMRGESKGQPPTNQT